MGWREETYYALKELYDRNDLSTAQKLALFDCMTIVSTCAPIPEIEELIRSIHDAIKNAKDSDKDSILVDQKTAKRVRDAFIVANTLIFKNEQELWRKRNEK